MSKNLSVKLRQNSTAVSVNKLTAFIAHGWQLKTFEDLLRHSTTFSNGNYL